METKYYTVENIEGEYAIIKNIEDGAEIFIAMALLPVGTDIGSKLCYENFVYTLC